MSDRRTLWLAAGCVAGLLLTGIPYWRLPHNADYFGDAALQLGFAGLAMVTAMLSASGVARLRRIFWSMLATFPTAVAMRVVVETARDPTDHNLWPFELIIAAIVSLAAVVPSLLVGALIGRLSR